MKFLLKVVLIALFVAPLMGRARAESDTAEMPKEYSSFFDEISRVMKAHPEAAGRFGFFDTKGVSKKPDGAMNSVTVRSSICGGGRCCTKWIDEGIRVTCIECGWCLP